MLTPASQHLIDLKCESLTITVAEHNKLFQRAGEAQQRSGIRGPDALAGYLVQGYFELFKNRVQAVHKSALEVISAANASEDLDAIRTYVDAKTSAFAQTLHQKITGISSSPFSTTEPTIIVVHDRLKKEFEFNAGVAIVGKKKDTNMTKSFHVHGDNYGQVGDGNKQTGQKIDAPPAVSGDIKIGSGEEKGVFKKYLLYPLIVVLIGAAFTWYLTVHFK